MDRLSQLLHRFSLRAGVFYTGQICGIHHFERDTRRGHVHLVKRGPVALTGGIEGTLSITEPTLLFLPRPDAHRLIADERDGADVVCASIQFGGGGHNPITDSLPSMILVRLVDLPGAQALLDLLYDEAFSQHCGRQAALDRLCELLLIRLLRHCMDQGLTEGGTLAGLSDPRLAKAVVALHEDAARPWELAGMFRSRPRIDSTTIVSVNGKPVAVVWTRSAAHKLAERSRPLLLELELYC